MQLVLQRNILELESIKRIRQCCFIDLQEAFDTVDHNILMNKTENYGFRGPNHLIVECYL